MLTVEVEEACVKMEGVVLLLSMEFVFMDVPMLSMEFVWMEEVYEIQKCGGNEYISSQTKLQ